MLITTCLHCKTQFRVTEKHLALADGLVVCSHCHKAFQAKDSLKEVDDNATVIFKKTDKKADAPAKVLPRLSDKDSLNASAKSPTPSANTPKTASSATPKPLPKNAERASALKVKAKAELVEKNNPADVGAKAKAESLEKNNSADVIAKTKAEPVEKNNPDAVATKPQGKSALQEATGWLNRLLAQKPAKHKTAPEAVKADNSPVDKTGSHSQKEELPKQGKPVQKQNQPQEKSIKSKFLNQWLKKGSAKPALKQKSGEEQKTTAPSASPKTPPTQKPSTPSPAHLHGVSEKAGDIKPVEQTLKIKNPPPPPPVKDTDPRKNIATIGRNPPQPTSAQKSRSWLASLLKKTPEKTAVQQGLAENAPPKAPEPTPAVQAKSAQSTAQQGLPENAVLPTARTQAGRANSTVPPTSIPPVASPSRPHFAPVHEPPAPQPIPIAPLRNDYGAVPNLRTDIPPHSQREFFDNRYLPPPNQAKEETNWTIATLIALIVLIMQMFYIILQK